MDDTERLDWMIKVCPNIKYSHESKRWELWSFRHVTTTHTTGRTSREAIDAAMSKEREQDGPKTI